jgi:hypothetical protein
VKLATEEQCTLGKVQTTGSFIRVNVANKIPFVILGARGVAIRRALLVVRTWGLSDLSRFTRRTRQGNEIRRLRRGARLRCSGIRLSSSLRGLELRSDPVTTLQRLLITFRLVVAVGQAEGL